MDVDWNAVGVIIGIIAAIGTAIAYIVRLEMRVKQLEKSQESTTSQKSNDDDPLTHLKKRLAKGEITLDEFEKLKKKIR